MYSIVDTRFLAVCEMTIFLEIQHTVTRATDRKILTLNTNKKLESIIIIFDTTYGCSEQAIKMTYTCFGIR